MMRLFSAIPRYSLMFHRPSFGFASYPKHQMPALSPTMSEGKVLKWLKKVGDQVKPGDILCDVQTDKATVGFEVQQKGYIAKINDGADMVKVGTPLVVLSKTSNNISQFNTYQFTQPNKSSPQQPPQQQPPQQQPPQQPQQQPPTTKTATNYPKHTQLKMPALSPTMNEGKILKWNVKVGESFSAGTSLCSVETDKATVQFEANQKGVLAKIIAPEATSLPVGQVLAISVKNKDDVDKFKDYTLNASDAKTQSVSPPPSQSPASQPTNDSNKERIFISPAAKSLANSLGIPINNLKGVGTGPDGRVIKQNVQTYQQTVKKQQPISTATSTTASTTASTTTSKTASTTKPTKFIVPSNPFEEIPLNGMRKTIAARLLQSKTTIPHYYINLSVTMDAIGEVRNQLNKNEKENGVKISINDIIIKAMALALRDYPDVNAQWNTNTIKKFKHADIGVAVATDGGLITPIVFRAETLGLIQIAKRTKDIAKRAREGKLDPFQYIGGTSTISNLGMFGVDSVTSVINPPQSTIIGVGQTAKKIVFDAVSTDRPYKVAQICELVVSADHRVVDGALAAQWVKRIQKYLENPHDMLL